MAREVIVATFETRDQAYEAAYDIDRLPEPQERHRIKIMLRVIKILLVSDVSREEKVFRRLTQVRPDVQPITHQCLAAT